MFRGLFLFTAAMIVATTSIIMSLNEPVEASMEYAIMSHAKPVEVPYLDMTINQIKERQIGRTDHASAGAEHLLADDNYQEPAGYREEHEEDPGDIAEEEPAESGECDPVLTYYGNCRITFYCASSCCCGEFANGYTASGEEAIPGWTCANGSLPFGTMVLIDGQQYCVTDRGVDGDQFDILVGSHEEALQRGLYYADVYIIG